MSNRRFRKYPQTIVLRCPCCQEVKYALCHFDSTGEAEYRCQCGYISKIKLAKLNNMKKKFKIKSCVKTCSACPSQWDLYTTMGQYIYARYRWGGLTLTLNMGKPNSEVIYHKGIGDGWDGVLSTSELKKHTRSVLDWSLMK